jgi:hypothetical protein
MVLGFILYESIDLLYNTTKITINVIIGTYNWYYNINTYVPLEPPDRFCLLEDKIDMLVRQIELTNLCKD